MKSPVCPIPSYANVPPRIFLDVSLERGVDTSWGVQTDEARIFECPASGLRFRLPAPPEKIAEFYQSEYHDRMVGSDNDARTEAYRSENRQRVSFLKQYCPSGRVLDVGCSTGIFAAQLGEAGFDAMGCDISEYACNKAAAQLGSERVFCAHVEDLAGRFPGSFDAITMMDVIEHFEDVVEPLRSARSMLRPDGVLFLRTPTLSSPFFRVADMSYRLTGGRYKNAILKIYHAEHFYFFTEAAMRALLRDTGYEVITIEPDPLLWKNFCSAHMGPGKLLNAALATVYIAGRMLGRGHGMKVVARRRQ